MRVRWSRVLRVRRSDPYRLSVGDEAVADFGPGLVELLDLRNESGRRLGDGLAPEWVVPIGAAGTAAFAVVSEEFNSWTAVSNRVELRRRVRSGETVVATARIVAMRRASVRIAYRIVGEGTGEPVAEGEFVFASAGPEGPKPFTPLLHATRGSEPPPPPESQRLARSDGGRRSAASRLAAALLPRSWFRAVRLGYWHLSSRRRSDKERVPLLKSLREVLRSDEGRPGPPAIRWVRFPRSLAPGQTEEFEIAVSNPSDRPLEGEVEVVPPFGFGLSAEWERAALRLDAGETAAIFVRVTAHRPHEVNLADSWMLVCRLISGGAEIAAHRAPVRVPDPEPGAVFYVLTNDCETFDGGETTGDYAAMRELGNHNGFMDPEDYRVQMIEKPDALNAIADRHGARWTHFWTVPQRFAAEWAARRSPTGAWNRVVRDLDDSVARGSRRHEYAPHIHFDYEPESALLPQPRLLYDRATDGLLPNEYYDPVANRDHKYHGWDGSRKGIAYVRAEGDLTDVDSKKGSLRKAVRYLAERSRLARPILTVRTGAADFGGTAEDLEISTRALFANGLLANSDAGVYAARSGAPRGRQIYFCRPDDLEKEIENLREASLVQVRAPTIQIDQSTAPELNEWFDDQVAEARGPGVRAIVGMTHAMFLKGSPDPFRDVRGGAFDELEHHLEHVRRAHPGVRFATASEAVLEFLDYYAPAPLAVAGPLRWVSADGTAIFAIRILGRTIPISPASPARVRVQVPPFWDAADVRRLAVLGDGAPIAGDETRSVDELPSIAFDATRHDGYDLRVETSKPLSVPALDAAETQPVSAAVFEAPPEEEMADLFRLEGPSRVSGGLPSAAGVEIGDRWEWRYPGDLFHLIVNPVAGHAHPLGRRLHPYGRFSEGIAIDAGLRILGDGWRPTGFDLEWVRPVRGGADFRLFVSVEAMPDARTVVLASSVRESGVEVARVRATFRREDDSAR